MLQLLTCSVPGARLWASASGRREQRAAPSVRLSSWAQGARTGSRGVLHRGVCISLGAFAQHHSLCLQAAPHSPWPVALTSPGLLQLRLPVVE